MAASKGSWCPNLAAHSGLHQTDNPRHFGETPIRDLIRCRIRNEWAAVITIKQIEALYWVHRLGSITAAAEKLHTSQSAITKRIADLEESFSVKLIECTHRNAALSAKGLEVYQAGKELLKQRDAVVSKLTEKRALTGSYRIGITESAAISWLPKFSARFRDTYPGITLQADVSESARLRERLLEGSLDFAVLDGSFQDLRLAATPLYKIELAWMCGPGLLHAARTYDFQDLARFPLLHPGPTSDLALIYDRVFAAHNLPQKATMTAPSLAALSVLARAGFGICCLPLTYCEADLASGALQVIDVRLPPQRVQVTAMFRHDAILGIAQEVMQLAQECAPADTGLPI